jgi:hypothetical protein
LRRLTALIIGSITLIAVACGGGDDDGDSPTTPQAASSPLVATSPAGTSSAGGAGQPAASGQALPDACTVLTDAEASQAMDRALGQRQGDPPTQALSRCTWTGAAGAGTRYVTVLFRQASFGMSVLNNNFKSRQGVQTLSGIVDEAYVNPGENQAASNYRFITLGAISGSYYIQLDVAGPSRDDAASVAVARTLLQSIAAKVRR